MDEFGFRWMNFLGLRLNCKKYDGEAKDCGGVGEGLGKLFLSLLFFCEEGMVTVSS